ncbi:MAG: glycosyltransferase family 87 protein [Candidatus Dormibacteria bacterium]
MSSWRAALARMRPHWRPSGELADRLALLLAAMVAFKFSNWLWLSARVPGKPALLANLILQYLAFGVFCLLVALACRRPLPRGVSRLRLHRVLWFSPAVAALVLVVVGAVIARPIAQNRLLLDDANVMAVCGARAVVSGHDPYQVAEIPCLASFHLPPTLATPYRIGALAKVKVYPTQAQILAVADSPGHGGANLFSPLGKPPLAALFMVPVAHAPAWQRAAWVLLPIVVLLAALALAAGPLWPAVTGMVLLTLYLNGSAINFAANGNGEAFAYALMALSVVWMRRPWLSAVCLGLAVGSNQLAWFFLPGYLLLAVDVGGLAKRAAGLAITLLAAVGPWLLLYPDALSHIYDTLRARTFPLGSGPIELVLGGFVAPPPRLLALFAAGLAITLIWLWGARWRTWRIGAGVLVLAAFWVSWRSLDEYLAQIPLLALVAVVVLLADPERRPARRDGPGGEAAAVTR